MRATLCRNLAALTGCLCFFAAACKSKPAETPPKAVAPAARAPQPILVGELGSMTGPEATFGASTRDGIALAINAFNQRPERASRPVKIILVDDQSRPEEAATAATKLIHDDKVVAILGEVASSRTLAAAPLAQAAKIPLVTPASTNPKVTETGDFIFRVCFVDSFQGRVMAIFAADNLRAGTAAILRDGRSDYSVGLAREFETAFAEFGGKILATETYQAGDADFRAQLTKIRDRKPEVLLVPGYYSEVGLILRQAKELGIKATIMGGDGWDSPKLAEIAGAAIEGTYFSNHYSSEALSAKPFVQAFTAAYGHAPDGFAAMGYDAALVLEDALVRTPDPTPEALREALQKTKDVIGVTGKISIDAGRNASKNAVVLKGAKDGFHYAATISPYPLP